MTEFVCKIENLKELCRIVSLKGKDVKGKEYTAIPDFLVVAEADGLRIKTKDNKSVLAVSLHYKSVKVTQAGVIAIGDVESFQSYLDRYNATDEVTVLTTENRIIITRANPQKVSRIPLTAEETLSNSTADSLFQTIAKNEKGYYQSAKTSWNIVLTLKAEDVKDVIDDGEVVKQRVYPWKLDQGLSIKVGDQPLGEIETSIPLTKVESENINPATKTSFAYGLDNIFGNLEGEVKVYLGNGMDSCPLILEKTTDKYSLVIFLAPAVIVE